MRELKKIEKGLREERRLVLWAIQGPTCKHLLDLFTLFIERVYNTVCVQVI